MGSQLRRSMMKASSHDRLIPGEFRRAKTGVQVGHSQFHGNTFRKNRCRTLTYPAGNPDDDDDFKRLDPDEVLVNRYLWRELSPDERAQFEARLDADDDFYYKVWPGIQIMRLPVGAQWDWLLAGLPVSRPGVSVAEMRDRSTTGLTA